MRLNYRAAFTKAIKRIKKANPENPIIIRMDSMIKSNGYLDYYEAQEDLGVRMGIDFRVRQVEVRKTVVWKAYLQVRSRNTSDEIEEVTYNGEYKSEAKAYEYVAKQHLYKLLEAYNITGNFAPRSE